MSALPRVLLVALVFLVNEGCSQPTARPTPPVARPPKVLLDAGTRPDSPAVVPSDVTNSAALASLTAARRLPSSVMCERPPAPAAPVAVPDGGVPDHDGGVADGGTGEGRRGHADKEVVRQIIRHHVEAIKSCYGAALMSHPHASGKVRTRFLISETGQITSSCVVSTTLNETEAERCMADEVLKWQFPKPLGGGVVIVEYPFILSPTEDAPN